MAARAEITGLNTQNLQAAVTPSVIWRQSSDNLTGTQTVAIKARGSSGTSGLNLRVAGYAITRQRA